MTALSWRNALLEIRNGVVDGTNAIFSQMGPTGTNMAVSQATVPLLPKRNDIDTGRYCTWSRISRGNWDRNSSCWWHPITVCEAPRSTIPTVPWLANKMSTGSWWIMETLDFGTLVGWQPTGPDLLSGLLVSGFGGVELSWCDLQDSLRRCRILDMVWRNLLINGFTPWWSLPLLFPLKGSPKPTKQSCFSTSTTTGITEGLVRRWSFTSIWLSEMKMMSSSATSLSSIMVLATWFLTPSLFLKGHSFFQCPLFQQILQFAVGDAFC